MTQTSLAEKLRIMRAQRGLSVAQASEQMGVARHTLRDLELARREPHYPTLAKIAAGYGVPVEELLGELVPLGQTELEARFHQAISRFRVALEKGEHTGNYSQAQLDILQASSIQSELSGLVVELSRAYFADPSDQLRALLGEFEELNAKLRGILEGLGGEPVADEERDQAQGEVG